MMEPVIPSRSSIEKGFHGFLVSCSENRCVLGGIATCCYRFALNSFGLSAHFNSHGFVSRRAAVTPHGRPLGGMTTGFLRGVRKRCRKEPMLLLRVGRSRDQRPESGGKGVSD